MVKTPEQHHDDLITAIDHELTTHGPQSLAEIIHVLIDARFDEDTGTHTPDWQRCKVARDHFRDLVDRLPAGPLPLLTDEDANG